LQGVDDERDAHAVRINSLAQEAPTEPVIPGGLEMIE
jgi:hypothetical protein